MVKIKDPMEQSWVNKDKKARDIYNQVWLEGDGGW